MKFFHEQFPPYNEKPIIISSEYFIAVPILKSVKQNFRVYNEKEFISFFDFLLTFPRDFFLYFTMIVGNKVEAAIYVTKIILLKFFNLFNVDIQTANLMNEIPWIPPPSNGYSNPAVVQIPGTQGSGAAEETNASVFNLYQTILNFPSICFTFTQVLDKNLFS
jgi:hypothetical protein